MADTLDGVAVTVASGVQIRVVEGVDEVRDVEALFADIWSTTVDRPPVNADVLRALAHTGCYVAGAYDGGPERRDRRAAARDRRNRAADAGGRARSVARAAHEVPVG